MSVFVRSLGALAIVATVLGGVSACGGNSTPTASAVPRASATPTADPSVAEVKAAATRFIEADVLSQQTGDPKPLDALVVPNSQAYGNDGVSASAVHDIHTAFVTRSLAYGRWTVSVTGPGATVSVDVTPFGHRATFPGLAPTESDHSVPPFTYRLTMEKLGDTWLVSRIG